MENQGKYALVTGATSGIGLELAKLFAKDGFNLVISARDIAELDEAATLLRAEGVQVLPIAKDLFDREQAFGLYADIKQQGIEIEILVNNAGQGVYGQFDQIDIDRELRIIDLNVASLVILTKCFLTDMIERKSGKILNLASVASKLPGPWQAVYHATKAFVLSFTEAVREETKDSGVTITALLPGVTDTDFFNKADMQDSKAVQDEDDMANPATVARDGYDALMAGKDKVISGFKNKVQLAVSALTPDSVVAHQLNKQQEPVDQR